jgi:aldehyde dehydrogenase (NAD+)
MALNIAGTVADLRRAFNTGKTKDLAWRKQQLRQLIKLVSENEKELVAALHKDLSTPRIQISIVDASAVITDAEEVIENIDSWAKSKSVSLPLTSQPAKGYTVREPYGISLIIGAWNFPVQLLGVPLVGAIAGGNCVLLKPSEVAVNASAFWAKYIPKYMDNECIKVIEGGVTETTEILKQKFDVILYTGNSMVGRIVMKAASEHLTPVILELGGKNPCIVSEDCTALEVAASRICWGKFLNVGQICLSPDSIYIHERHYDKMIELFKKKIHEFYGNDPFTAVDYSRVINERHVDRVAKLLEGQKITYGGKVDRQNRYIEPTIVENAPKDSPICQEEIFGPVMNLIKYSNLDDLLKEIQTKPKPLAFYLFSNSQKTIKKVVKETSSGGLCVNDVLVQGQVALPLGGVGESGMGCYHGKYSFKAFTHRKVVVERGTSMDPAVRYPPYNDAKFKMFSFFTFKAGKIVKKIAALKYVVLIAGLAYLTNYVMNNYTVVHK